MKGIFATFLLLMALTAFGQQENQYTVKMPEGNQPDSIRVFVFVEQAPEFPGGDGELVNFLMRNIVYPKKERRQGIEGRVLVKFILYEDGSVHEVTVSRSSGNEAIDAEAVRVVKLLPKFKPGIQQGKPVRVFYNLPIVFKLA